MDDALGVFADEVCDAATKGGGALSTRVMIGETEAGSTRGNSCVFPTPIGETMGLTYSCPLAESMAGADDVARARLCAGLVMIVRGWLAGSDQYVVDRPPGAGNAVWVKGGRGPVGGDESTGWGMV